MAKLYKSVLIVTAFVFSNPVFAQETAPALKPLTVAQMQGTYAGTFLCTSGEMGMTISLNDIGPVMATDGQNVDSKKRLIGGVLNFFPTVGNPDAPHGAFEMGGTAQTNRFFTRVKLNPGKWIDKPENFGASGLEGTIVNKTGSFNGKPTHSGCHTLKMTKLRSK